MKLSVIVPAFDCAGEIGGLLKSLKRTRLEDYEIIVVDDGSPDATARVCRSIPGVKVISLGENRGPARARNVGASRARGNVLVFADFDIRLPEDRDVLAEMTAVFDRDPEVDCVSTLSDGQPAVPNAVAYNGSVYHQHYMDLILGGSDERKGRIMLFTTRLGAIRASRFKESGGFHESLSGVMNEDGEFGARCYHLGFVSYFSRRLTHGHRFPTTLRRHARSYFLAAMVQAQIDRIMDTSPDESVSSGEKLRRLAAGGFLLVPLAVRFGPKATAVAAAAWGTVFLLSLGGLHGRVFRTVPWRHRMQWYAVYAGITPVIFAGYLLGLARHFTGNSLLRGIPSKLDYFSEGRRSR